MNYLSTPIPDLSDLRAQGKESYREYPIDASHPLFSEEIVDIADFGIQGSSYYSNPNKMTGKPLPGVLPNALVRYTVAEKLEEVNNDLRRNDYVSTRQFGGPLRLLVRDALRSYGLQKHIHDVVWPKLLREKNPDWDDQRLAEELPKFVAKPSDDLARPTPHMTGGAVDVNLVLPSGKPIDFGHVAGKVVSVTDYHEGYSVDPEYPADSSAKLARRILYHVMQDNGFQNNPTEWWHYSYGDQMWAHDRGESAAFYGAVEGNPDLK